MTLEKRIQQQIAALNQKAIVLRKNPTRTTQLERADTYETVAEWLNEILEADRLEAECQHEHVRSGYCEFCLERVI